MPKFGISAELSRKEPLMVGLLIGSGHLSSALIRALTWAPLSAVYTSPLDRAVATAHPLANDHGLDVHVRPALTDIDIDHGEGDARADCQRRIVEELMRLAATHQGETIAIVTHAEPIRCALAAFAGTALDDMIGIEITPGYVCAIGVTPSGVRRVLGVNMTATEAAS